MSPQFAAGKIGPLWVSCPFFLSMESWLTVICT